MSEPVATYTIQTSPKMLRETLCLAQTAISYAHDPRRSGKQEKVRHVLRLQELIDECDRHRPLGPDGKHGDLHTPTCGCEDKQMLLTTGKTTLLDIYEAAGGERSNDGKHVTITSGALKPFEITLRVVPTGVSSGLPEGETVTFAVLLDDDTLLEKPELGGITTQIEHSEELTLPVHHVNIKKEEGK